MKKAYLFGFFLSSALFTLPTGIYAQTADEVPEVGDGYHIFLQAHQGINDCSEPMVGSTNEQTIQLRAINLPDAPASCAEPAVLQVRDLATGVLIGQSAPITFTTDDWQIEGEDETVGLPCHDQPFITYYKTSVTFNFDVSGIPCCEDASGQNIESEVELEYMLASNPGIPYFDYSPACIMQIISAACLGHEEEDPNDGHSHDIIYKGKANICYVCSNNSQECFGGQVVLDTDQAPGGKGNSSGGDGNGKGDGDNDSGDTDGNLSKNNIPDNESSNQMRSSNTIWNNTLKTYPSPVTDNVLLEYTSEVEQESQIQIIDLSGKLVLNQTQRLDNGLNTISIPLSNQPQGIYLLRLWNGESWITQKIIKSK